MKQLLIFLVIASLIVPDCAFGASCLSPQVRIMAVDFQAAFTGQAESAYQLRSAKRKWLGNLITRNSPEEVLGYLELAAGQGVLDQDEQKIIEFAVRSKAHGPNSLDQAAASELGLSSYQVTRNLMGRSETDTVSIGFYERLGDFLRQNRGAEARTLKTWAAAEFREILAGDLVNFFHFTAPWAYSRHMMTMILNAWTQGSPRRTEQRKNLLRFWWDNPGKTTVQAAAELGMTRGNLRKRLASAQQEMAAVARTAGLFDPLMRFLERWHSPRMFKYLTGRIPSGEQERLNYLIGKMDDADFRLKDLPRSDVEKMIRLRLFENRSYLQLSREFGLAEASVNRFFEGRNPSPFREERMINVPGAAEKFRRFLEERLAGELQNDLDTGNDPDRIADRLRAVEENYGITLPQVRENVFLKQTENFFSGRRREISGTFSFPDQRVEVWGTHLNGTSLSRRKILTVKVFRGEQPAAGFVYFPGRGFEPKLICFEKRNGNGNGHALPDFYTALNKLARLACKNNHIRTKKLQQKVFDDLSYYAGVDIFQKHLSRFEATPLSAFRKTLSELAAMDHAETNPTRLNIILHQELNQGHGLKSAARLYDYFQQKHKIDIMQQFELALNGDGFIFPAFRRVYELLEAREDLPWLTPSALENLLCSLNYEARYSNTQYRVFRHWLERGHDIFLYWQQYEEQGRPVDESVRSIANELNRQLGPDILPSKNLNGQTEYYVRFILQSSGLIDKSLKEMLMDEDEKGVSLYEKLFTDGRDMGHEVLVKVDLERFLATLTEIEQEMVKAVMSGYSLDEMDLDQETQEKIFLPLVTKAEQFFSQGDRQIDQAV